MNLGRRWAFIAVGAVSVTSCAGGDDPSAATSVVPTTDTVPTTTAPTATTTAATTIPITTDTVEPSTGDDSVAERAECVVTVEAGDSLGLIASNTDLTITDLQDENRLRDSDVIHPGDELDVCIGNEFDDVAGFSREPPSAEAVERQQNRLNDFFAGTSMPELLVDGDSGPLTRQALCAARMTLDLRVDTVDMTEGSPEEVTLFEATSLSIPDGAATWANRWILIDQTCQVMFTGEGDSGVVDVFPTSTGEPGFETRPVVANPAFRFDPALDNDGWHDSTNFPVEIDNPLNGNMYKPLYFNGGQAIHGANYVPPEPRSKGCARMFPWHQDRLLAWLDLDDISEATWNTSRLGVTVTVQGEYRPAD